MFNCNNNRNIIDILIIIIQSKLVSLIETSKTRVKLPLMVAISEFCRLYYNYI